MGSVLRTCLMTQYKVPPKRIASDGASYTVALFRPIHVKYNINLRRLPYCVITSAVHRGESQVG